MVIHTDDCLIFASDDHIIDTLIQNLSKTYLLEDQGNVQDYLRIHISKDTTLKTITMTQMGLIEYIIKDLGVNNTSSSKTTPSDSILYPDTGGTPQQETWNYHSVIIGKLNFLAQNTRPGLSFAVHQCAWFCTHPTTLHELAVKWIARYLLYTKDKGLVLHPTKDFSLDMNVNADFTGMWHQQHSTLWDNVLSCTSYIITFCRCPIHWISKLQSEIALSTTESEYISLSMGTHELLPLPWLLTEIHQHTLTKLPLPSQFNTTKTTTLSATQVFEDNESCIVLAHSEGTKMRTKHIALKWYHFKDKIRHGFLVVHNTTGQTSLQSPLVVRNLRPSTKWSWAGDISNIHFIHHKREPLHEPLPNPLHEPSRSPRTSLGQERALIQHKVMIPFRSCYIILSWPQTLPQGSVILRHKILVWCAPWVPRAWLSMLTESSFSFPLRLAFVK